VIEGYFERTHRPPWKKLFGSSVGPHCRLDHYQHPSFGRRFPLEFGARWPAGSFRPAQRSSKPILLGHILFFFRRGDRHRPRPRNHDWWFYEQSARMALTVWLVINVALLVSIGFFSKQKPNGMALKKSRQRQRLFWRLLIVVLCRVRHPFFTALTLAAGFRASPATVNLHGRPSACHGRRLFNLFYSGAADGKKALPCFPPGFGSGLSGLFIGR